MNLKQIIEAAIMSADRPLATDKLLTLFRDEEKPTQEELKAILSELEEDYRDRGIKLKQVASGYRFQVREGVSHFVARLWEEKPPKYTRAFLETLSLIAYRQPITRGEIEDVRGVAVSSNIIKSLLERDWVRVVGHRDVPGKPALYATTKIFLDYFNLKNLSELPPLSEIKDLDKVNLELRLEESSEEREASKQASAELSAQGSEAVDPQWQTGTQSSESPESTSSMPDTSTDTSTLVVAT